MVALLCIPIEITMRTSTTMTHFLCWAPETYSNLRTLMVLRIPGFHCQFRAFTQQSSKVCILPFFSVDLFWKKAYQRKMLPLNIWTKMLNLLLAKQGRAILRRYSVSINKQRENLTQRLKKVEGLTDFQKEIHGVTFRGLFFSWLACSCVVPGAKLSWIYWARFKNCSGGYCCYDQ